MQGPSAPAAAPPPPDARRSSRYAQLQERLRSRQITMEEATELFGIMRTMLRDSEAARIARAAGAEAPRPAAKPKKAADLLGAAPDDLLAIGILAMGAGAGLLAAITKRMNETGGAPRPPTGRSSNSR